MKQMTSMGLGGQQEQHVCVLTFEEYLKAVVGSRIDEKGNLVSRETSETICAKSSLGALKALGAIIAQGEFAVRVDRASDTYSMVQVVLMDELGYEPTDCYLTVPNGALCIIRKSVVS